MLGLPEVSGGIEGGASNGFGLQKIGVCRGDEGDECRVLMRREGCHLICRLFG